jgi:hypothetical protein
LERLLRLDPKVALIHNGIALKLDDQVHEENASNIQYERKRGSGFRHTKEATTNHDGYILRSESIYRLMCLFGYVGSKSGGTDLLTKSMT